MTVSPNLVVPAVIMSCLTCYTLVLTACGYVPLDEEVSYRLPIYFRDETLSSYLFHFRFKQGGIYFATAKRLVL